ncbi:tyrosine recombinase XerC [Thermoclostridium caenicola]|uniref:Site-specific recombinase XerD n=1 Tax=Thermoclostridium caenicola TaxID=659425 RepID=A0A1M6EYM7_9FIRM|nr:tyrosine recombinase XerC [Thermoclostridium caenicola]SHI90557.1 Site-specific recombinase XerD [Thermoclostridium caenicola]HPO77673.1 tyrosine recombinase XerC [Thermoclostridium caenicola]
MSVISYEDMPDIAVEFLNYMLTIKGKSIKTVQEYYYDLRTFFRYIKLTTRPGFKDADFDTIDVRDITLDDIKKIDLADLYSFMSFISRFRGNSAVTRARKVACLRSFYKYLFTKVKLIDYNPAAELDSPKVVHRLPKYLNVDESIQLLESVEGKNQERDYAILVLFLNCGLRLSELVGINLSNIRGDTLTVIGKGNKERTIYLNQACLDAINAYLRVRPVEGVKDKNALFLSERKQRISPKTVQYLVKKYLGAAGLDTQKYSTHKLRHTAATLMYKHGHVDIRALQAILGHESIATTEIYTHIDDDQLRRAVESNPLSSYSGRLKQRGKTSKAGPQD